jgi:hypothetical protein
MHNFIDFLGFMIYSISKLDKTGIFNTKGMFGDIQMRLVLTNLK